MLLTITYTTAPATDLGYLLHKNPARAQEFELSFGKAHIFYPEATEERCTAALMLEIDPVGLVRGRGPAGEGGQLEQYVNDRPYVASSFLSVAIGRTLGTALGGRCKDRPELVEQKLHLQAKLATIPCRGGEEVLRRLFEPLGYTVTATHHPLDEQFPEWGESPYYTVELEGDVRLADLLSHLYVLVPVLDNEKHYWVGDDEVEKLLRHGSRWLTSHPEREMIALRYLKHRRKLARQVIARLDEESPVDPDEVRQEQEQEEEAVEAPISLNQQRMMRVMEATREVSPKRVVDLGCGEGKLLKELLAEKSIDEIVGIDVAHRVLEIASERLGLERMPERQRERIKLLHGSLMYRDKRLAGFDVGTVVEVIEHLDQPRLDAFERVVFEAARPARVIVTTPNAEYNVLFPTLPAGKFRHRDHRFEWTRAEFQGWAKGIASRYGYAVEFRPVGPEHEEHGSPTQMGVFDRDVSGV